MSRWPQPPKQRCCVMKYLCGFEEDGIPGGQVNFSAARSEIQHQRPSLLLFDGFEAQDNCKFSISVYMRIDILKCPMD
jgi:hypothetical protein